MKNLLNQNGVQIAIDKNEPRISHKVIAEALGITAKSMMQLITDYQHQIQAMGILRFQNAVLGKRGQPERIAYLNEDQCYLVLALVRNTEKSVAAKIQLVKAFRAARESIAIRETEYIPMRNACHAETALIVEQAKACGSTAPLSSFYSNIERMINKIFGIEPKSRDALTAEQRLQVSMAYSISTNAAKEVLSQGRPYKEAYALAKERITQFAKSMSYPTLEVAA